MTKTMSTKLNLGKNFTSLAFAAAISAVACGGTETGIDGRPEEELEIGETDDVAVDEDAITAAEVAGTWEIDVDAPATTYGFIGCNSRQGCKADQWRSLQQLLDQLCKATGGQICLPLTAFHASVNIRATSNHGLVLTLPGGRNIGGIANPFGNQAFFLDWNSLVRTTPDLSGGITNANGIAMTVSNDAGAGEAYVTFGAGLVVPGYVGGGLLLLRIPFSGTRAARGTALIDASAGAL